MLIPLHLRLLMSELDHFRTVMAHSLLLEAEIQSQISQSAVIGHIV